MVGDSKTYGVTDPPGSCGPRDPMYGSFISVCGGTLVGTLTGGDDNGSNLTPCPISGLSLAGEGHSGFHCQDITPAITGWYGSIATPNVGVMYAGTNDLIAMATAPPNQGWNLDKFGVDFTAMVAAAVALNTKLPWFVCNMDLMPALLAAVPTQLQQVNAFIGSVVKQYQRQGFPMYLIDLASAPGITYNSGGIHQDVAGYAATAARMVSAITTLRPAG